MVFPFGGTFTTDTYTRLSAGPVSPSDSTQDFRPPFRDEYPTRSHSAVEKVKGWWRRSFLGVEEEQAPSSLLTLIPLNDSRLRPRRTRLLVVSLLVLALAAALATFFLVPRGVSAGAIEIESEHMSWNISKGTYQLNLQAHILVNNPNYVNAQVEGQLKVFFYDTEAGAKNISSIVVPARSTLYSLDVVVDASNVPNRYAVTILSECAAFPRRLVFFLKGHLTATGGLWGGSMGQIDIDTYLMIKCFNSGEDVTFLSASQPPDAAASDQDP